jgi:hypothetical protein
VVYKAKQEMMKTVRFCRLKLGRACKEGIFGTAAYLQG